MEKERLIERLMEVIPDEATVIFATVTILTEDFQTLHYDTDSDEVS